MTAGVATPHNRRVPIATAFNLRDFGGYATADGRMVRRGMLYRSGTMALLTDADSDQFRALGIRAICDFRRPSERQEEPTRWHGAEVDYHCRDYSGSTGVLGEMLHGKAVTRQEMHDAMVALYREIAMEYAPSYRAMFGQIAGGRVPILINCSAGKDRTGVGAALILAALGVPRATIVEDYLLTNTHADWDWRLSLEESRLARAHRSMKEVIAPVLLADALYIETLFETLDAAHGGIEAYLEDVLGIDPAARAALQDALLEA